MAGWCSDCAANGESASSAGRAGTKTACGSAANGYLRKSVCAAVRATPGAVASASCAMMNYSARSRHRERFEAKPDEHCHLLLRRLRLQAAGSPCERHSCRTGRGRGRIAARPFRAIRYRGGWRSALLARADARISERGRGDGTGTRHAGMNCSRMISLTCQDAGLEENERYAATGIDTQSITRSALINCACTGRFPQWNRRAPAAPGFQTPACDPGRIRRGIPP